MNSTLLLSRPPLPFFALSGQVASEIGKSAFYGATDTAQSLSFLYEMGLDSTVLLVMREMKAYSRVIEDYMEGSSPYYDAQAMCDLRNLVQYHLMSIEPISGPGLEAISEICRLAMVIYSIGVTFPLIGIGDTLATLAKQLHLKLQDELFLDSWPLLENGDILCLWIIMMGGIAAATKSLRHFFVKSLAEVMYCSHNVQWRRVEEKLRMLLWLDSACNPAGIELWNEAYSHLQSQAQKDPAKTLLVTTLRPPCAQCRVKKVKCDRGVPCQHCTKSGLECSSDIPTRHAPARVHTFSTRQKPCELCQKRRVRCDKGKPCSRCADGGLKCVYLES